MDRARGPASTRRPRGGGGGRRYRLGQQRDVRIYRLVALGTIEEAILMRQLYKDRARGRRRTRGVEVLLTMYLERASRMRVFRR